MLLAFPFIPKSMCHLVHTKKWDGSFLCVTSRFVSGSPLPELLLGFVVKAYGELIHGHPNCCNNQTSVDRVDDDGDRKHKGW